MGTVLILLGAVLSAYASYASLVFDGCDASFWTESYYSSQIFPSTSSSPNHCIQIPTTNGSALIAEDNHIIQPTVWFDTSSESNVYYDIRYNFSCDVNRGSFAKNVFYFMFRVESIDDTDSNEFNDNFEGYALVVYGCGRQREKLSIFSYSNTAATRTELVQNSDLDVLHSMNIGNGDFYDFHIVVGDAVNKDPTYHEVYVNNILVLNFTDDAHLYGGIGLSAYLDATQSNQDFFYINSLQANGIGFNHTNTEEEQQENTTNPPVDDDNKNDNVSDSGDLINCEKRGKIKHINWVDLAANGGESTPTVSFEATVSKYSLTLNLHVELDYVGYSYADRLDTYGYGTSYVLDFASFDAHSSSIFEPGSCSNRLFSTFNRNGSNDDVKFRDYWNYSVSPYVNGHIGATDDYLAYPKPSEFWSLYTKNSRCGAPIVYDGKFNLNDLRACGNADGSKSYLHFENTADWMNISGTFYINLVSPINKEIDIGYYYVYQLLSYPFVISIKKSVHVLSSNGISLFTLSFVAVYKQESESKYRLILLTESADYLFLQMKQLLITPSPQFIAISESATDDGATNSGVSNRCLTVRNNICSQLFEISSAAPIDCANDIFSGEYGIRFDISCNPDIANDAEKTQICRNWLDSKNDALDDDNTVDLFIDITFQDLICDVNTDLIEFQAQMLFYSDTQFQQPIVDGESNTNDAVYVAIQLNFEEDAFQILSAKLSNVWLCTVDPALENQQDFIVSQSGDQGGCFAVAIIDENQPFHIIQNGQVAVGYRDDLQVAMYDISSNGNDHRHQARFKFNVPKQIVRSKLYVHVQLQIQLKRQQERRILLDEEDANDADANVQDQIRHFMDFVSVQNNRDVEIQRSDMRQQEDEPQRQPQQPADYMPSHITYVFVIVIVILVLALAGTCIYRQRGGNNTSMRHADEESIKRDADDEEDELSAMDIRHDDINLAVL